MSLTVTLNRSFITQNQFVCEPCKRSFVLSLPQGLDLIYITVVSFSIADHQTAKLVVHVLNHIWMSPLTQVWMVCKSLFCFNHKVTCLTYFFKRTGN